MKHEFIDYQIIILDFTRYCTKGLGPHLFVKVPRLGDSEGIFAVFESSCHMLLPV